MKKTSSSVEELETLLNIVKYLNSVQDPLKTTIASNYNTTTIVTHGRHLNAHEEDLLNSCLIRLKKLTGFKLCLRKSKKSG